MQIYIYFMHCKQFILFQVGWSRANLVQKLEENPNGVTLILRRLPGFLKRKESRAKSEVGSSFSSTYATLSIFKIIVDIIYTLKYYIYTSSLAQRHWNQFYGLRVLLTLTQIWFGYEIRSWIWTSTLLFILQMNSLHSIQLRFSLSWLIYGSPYLPHMQQIML